MCNVQRHRFFLLWFVIVSACIYLGILLSSPLEKLLWELDYGMPYCAECNDGAFEGIVSLLFAVGLSMGVGQWIAINTRIKKAYGWIFVTLFGFSIGIFVSAILFGTLSLFRTPFNNIIEWVQIWGAVAGAGMLTGFCQWISLRRKRADSLKWSFGVALSYVMAVASGALVSRLSKDFGLVISTVTFGLVSGVFAERLIIPSEQQDSQPQELAS
jgi:hypothetical protein